MEKFMLASSICAPDGPFICQYGFCGLPLQRRVNRHHGKNHARSGCAFTEQMNLIGIICSYSGKVLQMVRLFAKTGFAGCPWVRRVNPCSQCLRMDRSNCTLSAQWGSSCSCRGKVFHIYFYLTSTKRWPRVYLSFVERLTRESCLNNQSVQITEHLPHIYLFTSHLPIYLAFTSLLPHVRPAFTSLLLQFCLTVTSRLPRR